MVLGQIALVALVWCIGASGSDKERPSEREFKLFCRILEEADRMLADVKDYIYDEGKDRKILEEMEVLFNATTSNMNEFRKTLWETRDFFEEYPPPTDPENRKRAHNEIGKLIDKGEKKIQENREIAVKVNEKIEEARLSVLQGLYGPNVTVVPKDERNWTKVRDNATNIFNHDTNVSESCGHDGKGAGKTLFNDLFCVCVGEGGDKNPNSPCSANFVPPKNTGYGTGNQGTWTQMKYEYGHSKPLSLVDSIGKIIEECGKGEEENLRKSMFGLLKDFEEMIGKGYDEVKTNKKIFGHSGRSKGSNKNNQVTKCDGTKGNTASATKEEGNNENICVDYTKNISQDGKTYNIPWHENFRSYYTRLKEAKNIEEKILKNRAALLLLKSEAWIAYSHEKDDETSNLDDMNVSHLFDATQLHPSFPPFLPLLLFPFVFLLS